MGLTWLAGIGFTMALFIAELAFVAPAGATNAHLAEAKIGIFLASLAAGIGGCVLLRAFCPTPEADSTH